jgi:cell volume regulation protein A
MELAIGAIGLTILMGFFGNVLFQRTNIPNTLWLLLFGMLLGSLHFIGQDFISSMAGVIGAIAVIGVLSDGGLNLDLKYVVSEGFRGALLMLAGFVSALIGITALLMVMGFPFLFSFLVAMALAGISGSVAIPTITSLSFLSARIKTILSIESISDTFSMVIAIFLIDFLSTGKLVLDSVPALTQGVALEVFSALSIGIIFGLLWGPFIGKLKKFDYSYAATLGALFLLFAFSESINSSGAITVFAAGIMLANAHTIYKALFPELEFEQLDQDISKTHSLFAFLIRVFFFVFLGIVVGIPELSFMVIGLLITGIIVLFRYFYVNAFIHFNLIKAPPKKRPSCIG